MRAIIALAVLVGCAETETTEEAETTTETETTEQTTSETFEDVADRVEENFSTETTEAPAKTTTPSGESAVSSD